MRKYRADKEDTAGIKIPPPLIYASFIALGLCFCQECPNSHQA